MWLLDRVAQRYRVRPSELLDIPDTLTAYQLDEAVFIFCSGVEGAMNDIPMGKGKKASEKRERAQKEVFNRLMKLKETVKQKFRDPAEMMK